MNDLQLSARLMTAESLSDSSFAKQKQLEAQNKKLQSELEVGNEKKNESKNERKTKFLNEIETSSLQICK